MRTSSQTSGIDYYTRPANDDDIKGRSGTRTKYIYDGINPAALSGNALLGSLNIDEIFAQVSSTGTTGYLRDGLNSTVGETGSAGTLTANYWYSPYGDSANTSAAPTPLQFTGRENDGATGLYYYRARYYSPQLGRFISEDPIGLAGGTNYYAYAGGDPVSNVDPSGLFFTSVDAACAIDPGFCAEIMGQIVRNIGAISGNSCLEQQANDIANGLNKAAAVAGVIFFVNPVGEANVVVNGIELSTHAAQQASVRGISITNIATAISEGEAFQYVQNGETLTGYYNAATNTFVGVGERITTVMNPARANYIQNLKARTGL